jgi:hypothetical protein
VYNQNDLRREAEESLEAFWFVRSLIIVDRTELTLSLRLYIRSDLFVQAFLGERSGALYFALIEGGRRIFGIDREADEWHLHPYEDPTAHKPLLEGLEPKPLLTFLARVEDLLLEHTLL